MLAIILVALFLRSWETGSETDWSKSVLGFGGALRSGTFFVDKYPEKVELIELWDQVGQTATKHQPLIYVSEAGETLFFARVKEGGGGELVEWDLHQDRVRHIHDLGQDEVVSTPVLLAESKEIWFLVRDRSQKGFYPVLRKISLSGGESCRLGIDLGEGRDRLHCVTAMSYEPATDRLVFGCSLGIQKEGELYGVQRGITGLLVQVQRSRDRCPLASEVKKWSPARISASEKSGFDTGIWMSGAAPLTPGDGTVWLTTGNGLYAPEQGNYGCSLLRLNLRAENLEPRVVWAHDRGENGIRTHECSMMNIDPSSSGVAFSRGHFPWKQREEAPQALWRYFVFGKDSNLKWGRGDVNEETFLHRVGWYLNYGQPAVTNVGRGTVLIAMQNSVPRTHRQIDARWDQVPAEKCQGVILKNPPDGPAKRVQLWYSGAYRKDRVLALEGSQASSELANYRSVWADEKISYRYPEGSFPPYVVEKTLGWMPAGEENRPEGFSWARLLVSRGDGFADLLNSTSVKQGAVSAGDVWVPQKSGQNCVGMDSSRFVFLGPVQEETYPSLVGENRLEVLILQGGRSPRSQSRWTESAPEWQMTRTSPSIGVDPTGALLVAVTLTHSAIPGKSKLVLVNPWDGSKKAEIQFEGTPHFSMPIFYRDRVFVATREPDRLHMFHWRSQ